MEDDVKDIELVEQYILGNLGDGSRRQFRERLKGDKDLQLLYKDMSLMINGIKKNGSLEQLQQLRELESTLEEIVIPEPRQAHRRLSFGMLSGIAATLSIIIVAFLYFFNDRDLPNNQSVFDNYFETYPNEIAEVTRDSDNQVEDERIRAYMFYDQARYADAIASFKVIPLETDRASHIFYMGVSYLAINDVKNAQDNLLKYIEMNELFKWQAQWYLGLTYLKTEQNSKALATFKLISAQDNSYKSRSDQIIEWLESN